MAMIIQIMGGMSHTTHRGWNEISTPHINNMFNRKTNNNGRVLRSEIRGDVWVPKYHLEISKGNIAHRGGRYYNDIPHDTRNINSNKAFTRKLQNRIELG